MSRGPSAGDERGSLVIALAVVLILSGLALAALARTVSAVRSTRISQDDAAATAAADAGVADALFALDNVSTDASVPPSITTGGTGAVGAAGATYRWTANVASAGTVVIMSVGTVNGRRHQVDATATRPLRWPWAVATTSSLVLDGPGSLMPNTSMGGRGLGTKATMVLRNSAPGGGAGASQWLLGPAAACSGCTAAVQSPPVTFPDAVVPPAAMPCPGTGGGRTHGTITSLSAGTYVCTGDVSLAGAHGVVPVAGPVVIYMINGADGRGGPTTLDISEAPVVAADATQLVVHKIGAGTVVPGDASTPFTGVIDAPQATMRSAACALNVTGSLVLGSFACTASGAPGPQITWDTSLDTIWSSDWSVGAYHDAPVGTSGP